MNRILKLIAAALLIVTASPAFSQKTSPYQVATWPGYRSCAISYTFDDGCTGQFAKAIPIFDEFGYKLTLFTVASWVGNDWSNLKSAAVNGHEVANHTLNHPRLDTMTIDAQKTEIKTSNDLINTNVTAQKSLTMATPYCAEGNDALAASFFIAVRGCQGFIEPKTPGNFMNVSSVMCGDQGVKKTSEFKNKANSAASSKGWLVYLIHGVDNDGGYSPLASDTLRQSLVYLKENDSKFWVTTFGNAARYIKERNCVSFTETSSTDTSITVTIADTLSHNDIFNYPLTIRRTLPEGWSQATVAQNGLTVTDTVIEINSVKYLQFDAVPDGGSVVITKVVVLDKKDKTGFQNNDLKFWIQNDAIKIQIPESCTQNPSVSIYNIMGQLLLKSENVNTSSGLFNISPLPFKQSGIYFIRLTDDHTSWSKKIQWF